MQGRKIQSFVFQMGMIKLVLGAWLLSNKSYIYR